VQNEISSPSGSAITSVSAKSNTDETNPSASLEQTSKNCSNMIKEYNHFVIRIKHKLESQDKLDLAINRMEALGLTIISNWDIKKIQEFNEHFASNPNMINNRFFLSAKTIEMEDFSSITDDDFQKIADDCLMWFGDDCLLKLEKEFQMPSPFPNEYRDVFYKGKPTCKCGLVVNHQKGITFNYVKVVLERNGFSNIILNEENYMWMKIDFDATSLFIPDFGKRYLKDSGINSFKVFGNRANSAYSKKNLSDDKWAASLKVVKVKSENLYDFSGDDLSLDPRMW
jgi:hypothetical protein